MSTVELLLFQGRNKADYPAWLEALKLEHGADRVIEVARGLVRLLPKWPKP